MTLVNAREMSKQTETNRDKIIREEYPKLVAIVIADIQLRANSGCYFTMLRIGGWRSETIDRVLKDLQYSGYTTSQRDYGDYCIDWRNYD